MTGLHLLSKEYGQRPSDLADPAWDALGTFGLRWQFDLAVAVIGKREEARLMEQGTEHQDATREREKGAPQIAGLHDQRREAA